MGKEKFYKVPNIDKKKHFSIVESSKKLPLVKSYCTAWPFTVNEICGRDCFDPHLPGMEVSCLSQIHRVPSIELFVIQAWNSELQPQRKGIMIITALTLSEIQVLLLDLKGEISTDTQQNLLFLVHSSAVMLLRVYISLGFNYLKVDLPLFIRDRFTRE